MLVTKATLFLNANYWAGDRLLRQQEASKSYAGVPSWVFPMVMDMSRLLFVEPNFRCSTLLAMKLSASASIQSLIRAIRRSF